MAPIITTTRRSVSRGPPRSDRGDDQRHMRFGERRDQQHRVDVRRRHAPSYPNQSGDDELIGEEAELDSIAAIR